MNVFTLKACILEFHRDAVLQVVHDPDPLVLPVLIEAGGFTTQQNAVDGELEVDAMAFVEFTCFLKNTE